MAKKTIARIEELLGDTITEVTLYKTPAGAVFKTKEEAITSIIAIACPHGDSKECRVPQTRVALPGLQDWKFFEGRIVSYKKAKTARFASVSPR